MKQRYEMDCSVAQTLNLIGDRWSMLILWGCICGRQTYKELQDALTGIPSNLLSERLKSLERDGLLQSELYREHPPRYRYRPTEKGAALRDLFNCMILWAQRYLPECGHRIAHQGCGGEVSMHYSCGVCGQEIRSDAIAVSSAPSEDTPPSPPPE
ncbi:MAG: helix-turn-helix transcriptional regulator [Provencibacterium sp.]|jgi:DNA-binding HxlR family transcriptional regulator|nr:helix-turn-helix transcriptional regulator [Provencibacterium sp.]